MSVDSWKSVFDVAAVLLLFLTFIAGAGVLLTGNVINERQSKQLRAFDKDLTGAKIELADVNAKAEGFRLEIAKATESAAEANKVAEGERLARIKLAASISWRTPDRALIPHLTPPLRRFAGQRYAFVVDPGDPERSSVVSWVIILLAEANWKAEPAPLSA